jgi:hypothetical protein
MTSALEDKISHPRASEASFNVSLREKNFTLPGEVPNTLHWLIYQNLFSWIDSFLIPYYLLHLRCCLFFFTVTEEVKCLSWCQIPPDAPSTTVLDTIGIRLAAKSWQLYTHTESCVGYLYTPCIKSTIINLAFMFHLFQPKICHLHHFSTIVTNYSENVDVLTHLHQGSYFPAYLYQPATFQPCTLHGNVYLTNITHNLTGRSCSYFLLNFQCFKWCLRVSDNMCRGTWQELEKLTLVSWPPVFALLNFLSPDKRLPWCLSSHLSTELSSTNIKE